MNIHLRRFNLAKMRRHPVIHGPGHRVVLLSPEEPTVAHHAGARHYIDRLREVYPDRLREIHLEVLNPDRLHLPEVPLRIRIEPVMYR